MANDPWALAAQALVGGLQGYQAKTAANEKQTLENKKLQELVNASRIKEWESGFTRDEAGSVNFDPSFVTEGSPAWQRSNREAELKRLSSGQKGSQENLTLDQLVAAEKARETGIVPENMRDIRISPSYNFRSTARPPSGLTAQVLRAQGYSIDASIPDDYVIPTGALQYANPGSAPPAQKDADREQKERLEREKREHQARLQAERLAAQKAAGGALTPAQKAVDTNFGKSYAEYQALGGRAKTEAELGGLREIPKKLEKRKYGLFDRVIGVLPKFGRDLVDPELSSLEDGLKKAIQGTIGQVLDSQYAAREADAVFERSWNPRLSPSENAKRIRAEIKRIESMAADKERASQYYEENGTLAGFVPDRRTLYKKDAQDKAPAARTVAKKQYSPSRKQTKITYSDGSEEIVDGKK